MATSPFLHQPPSTGSSPLSSKKFCTPRSDSILGRSYRPLLHVPTVHIHLKFCSQPQNFLKKFSFREVCKMHHFFLAIGISMQIVSAFFVSNFGILFAIKLSRKWPISPPPFEFLSLLNGGNWCPSILNWWFGKLEPSLVSSTQRTWYW